jgi:hypothetical protein
MTGVIYVQHTVYSIVIVSKTSSLRYLESCCFRNNEAKNHYHRYLKSDTFEL